MQRRLQNATTPAPRATVEPTVQATLTVPRGANVVAFCSRRLHGFPAAVPAGIETRTAVSTSENSQAGQRLAAA